jgi:hypothetical protein
VSWLDDPTGQDDRRTEHGHYVIFSHLVLGELRTIAGVPVEVLSLAAELVQPGRRSVIFDQLDGR